MSELLTTLKDLTSFHISHCEIYKRYVETVFPFYDKATSLEELPWVPVKAFKQFELRSITKEKIFKTMFSSGTGGAPSQIVLDQQTARLQQSKLIEAFQMSFGTQRFPMLVIDSESSAKDRNNFSARTAAINGFSIFSRGRDFALNDDLEIDLPRVQRFLDLHAGKQLFIFGFTFVVWEKLVLKLEKLGLTLNLANAFILHGGGWKKLEDQSVGADEFKRRIAKVLNCHQVYNYYGMIEQTGSIYLECKKGNLHAPTGSDVIIRSIETFSKVDHNTQGLIQLFSSIQKSYPGHSLLTEDIGHTLEGSHCNCGNLGTILKVKGRLKTAEVRGCSDAVNR